MSLGNIITCYYKLNESNKFLCFIMVRRTQVAHDENVTRATDNVEVIFNYHLLPFF